MLAHTSTDDGATVRPGPIAGSKGSSEEPKSSAFGGVGGGDNAKASEFRGGGSASSFKRFWNNLCDNVAHDFKNAPSRARDNMLRVDRVIFSRSSSRQFTLFGGVFTLGLIGWDSYKYLFGIESKKLVIEDIKKKLERLDDRRVQFESLTMRLSDLALRGTLSMHHKMKIVEVIDLVIEKLVKPRGEDVENLDEWRVRCHAKLMMIKSNL